jgi:putative oxidoreductase
MTSVTTHVRSASAPASARHPARSPFGRLLSTTNDAAPAIARVALGVVMFPHGAQKVLGWFGGHGFAGTLQFFTGKLGIPVVFALLAMAGEFLGALGLIAGVLSRVAAFGVACVMLVAVFTVHTHNGFFMNWTGQQAGEGFEYHLLAIALAIIVIIRGGGAWSFDGWSAARLPMFSTKR